MAMSTEPKIDLTASEFEEHLKAIKDSEIDGAKGFHEMSPEAKRHCMESLRTTIESLQQTEKTLLDVEFGDVERDKKKLGEFDGFVVRKISPRVNDVVVNRVLTRINGLVSRNKEIDDKLEKMGVVYEYSKPVMNPQKYVHKESYREILIKVQRTLNSGLTPSHNEIAYIMNYKPVDMGDCAKEYMPLYMEKFENLIQLRLLQLDSIVDFDF